MRVLAAYLSTDGCTSCFCLTFPVALGIHSSHFWELLCCCMCSRCSVFFCKAKKKRKKPDTFVLHPQVFEQTTFQAYLKDRKNKHLLTCQVIRFHVLIWPILFWVILYKYAVVKRSFYLFVFSGHFNRDLKGCFARSFLVLRCWQCPRGGPGGPPRLPPCTCGCSRWWW